MIYLRSDTEVLIKRIRNRGRDYEQSIKAEYLNRLSQFYDIFFDYVSHNYPQTSCIICDTTNKSATQVLADIMKQLEKCNKL